ncbi:MAG: hypothetical protein CMJ81_20730 [Planctomycetaceae bacterium]|nr:hypothetical protein [Planctomycetaceae bacterium]
MSQVHISACFKYLDAGGNVPFISCAGHNKRFPQPTIHPTGALGGFLCFVLPFFQNAVLPVKLCKFSLEGKGSSRAVVMAKVFL